MKGFFFTQGNVAYFLVSDHKNITDNIARKFITALCADRNKSDELCRRACKDKATLADFKYRISSDVSLEEVTNRHGSYYSIQSKWFGGSYDLDEIKVIY